MTGEKDNTTGSVKGFFAYPSRPLSIQDTICNALRDINSTCVCHIKTWQECHVGGKVVIDVICRAIDEAQIFCADLTGANPNVMFELGYAIARKKRIWLILDETIEASKKMFEQIRILTTVGYISYCNSRDIIRNFFNDKPWENLIKDSIYAMSIEPTISSVERETLLYLKTRHNTEAATRLSTYIESYLLPLTIDDPSESAVQPLSWYAKKILSSVGVIVHLCSPSREGAHLHNTRYAFVSGLAYGFQIPLLILAETDYESPIDYRDILKLYKTPTECVQIASHWLDNISSEYARRIQHQEEYKQSIILASDLKNLRVGEYIAENEQTELNEYFVETSAFLEALEGRHTLMVGRKGTGKTANLLTIASRLKSDKRNLVCVVKPVSYELESIIRLLKKYRERDEKGYLVEALWKFLLLTEIAKTFLNELESKPYAIITGSVEDQLVQILDRNDGELRQDFAIRLERAVHSLVGVSSENSIENFRLAVSEKLHVGVLKELRAILGKVLSTRRRVAVLIDNLDKAWTKRNDLEYLTEFLLGLLRVSRDIRQDFTKQDHWREPVTMTLTIFMRSDIFSQLMKIAREPDKISYSKLLWDDSEMLLRVIDSRLEASRGGKEYANKIWSEMFCSTVQGIPVRKYLVDHVLPRPRDIVYFTSASIANAVNRAHIKVEERDIIDAEKQYSQFAFESIQVENGITVPELETILYEFVGQKAVLAEPEVKALIKRVGIDDQKNEDVIHHLCSLSFLGVETSHGTFEYSSEDEEAIKNEMIAKKRAAASNGIMMYKINPPFHAFLEIDKE